MSKATEGEWFSCFNEEKYRHEIRVRDLRESCGRLGTLLGHTSGLLILEEDAANAEMFSRAPQLRDALRDLLEAMPSCPGTVVSGSGGHTVHANDCGKPATHGCDGSLFGYCADHAGTHDEPDWWHDAVARIRAALDGL